MPGVRKYLKQTATLKRVSGFDDHGQLSYGPPETIRVRKVPADGRTVNALGAEVQNRTRLLTDTEVGVGDLIDDAAVEGVEAIVDKRGRTSGYRVEL